MFCPVCWKEYAFLSNGKKGPGNLLCKYRIRIILKGMRLKYFVQPLFHKIRLTLLNLLNCLICVIISISKK